MLYCSAEEWTEWGILDECHQFFSLHWTELFDTETPDTWQVRTCNVRTVLHELKEAAHIAKNKESYRTVLRSLLDEAFAIIKRDVILAAYHPFVADYLEPWRDATITEKSVAEVDRLANVILGNLDGYWDNGVAYLLDMLRAPNPGKKLELYAAAMNLGVETIARGHSPTHLRNIFVDTVLTKSEVGFVDRVAGMFHEFAKGMKEFSCVILTEGIKRDQAECLPTDTALQYGRPSEINGLAAKFYRRVGGDTISLKVQVTAADPEAARHLANQRLGEVFAGLNLFSVDDRFIQKQMNMLVTDGEGKQTIAGYRRVGSHYLGSYDSRQVKLDLLFRVQQRIAKADAAHLSAALQYHRLAMLAVSDEAKLVNMWIGLEALCQGGDGSIIKGVTSRIAPCVAVDNIRKNIVSLALYVRFLWNDSDKAEFLALFPNSFEDHLDPDDLLSLLLLHRDDPKIARLCQLCARHPLILHRLYRTKMMLNEPSSIAENLAFTHQNVDWQLKRIYRARNAIMHTGRGNSMLPQLTQHLHCYLLKTIHSVLFELDRQPGWSISDALDHRRKLFAHFAGFLKSTERHRVSRRAIMQPRECMAPQTAPFAWPPDSCADAATKSTTVPSAHASLP